MTTEEREALLGQYLRHPDEQIAKLAELALTLYAQHELIVISLKNHMEEK